MSDKEEMKKEVQATLQVLCCNTKHALGKATSFSDKFLCISFSCAKYISAVLMMIAVLSCLWFILQGLFTTSDGLEIPRYGVRAKGEKEKRTETAGAKEVQEISEKYGRKIIAILEKTKGLNDDMTTSIKKDLEAKIVYIPSEYRSDFIDGLEDYIKDLNRDVEKRDLKNVSYPSKIESYVRQFDTALDRIAENDQNAAQKRGEAWTKVFGSIGLFLIALILPVLLRIEENTRRV